jgi:exonuclease VII small subunit
VYYITEYRSCGNGQWREDQAEKIAQRDEESKRKRQETIARAEKEIDKLYEDYNSKKERTIRENKCVTIRPWSSLFLR